MSKVLYNLIYFFERIALSAKTSLYIGNTYIFWQPSCNESSTQQGIKALVSTYLMLSFTGCLLFHLTTYLSFFHSRSMRSFFPIAVFCLLPAKKNFFPHFVTISLSKVRHFVVVDAPQIKWSLPNWICKFLSYIPSIYHTCPYLCFYFYFLIFATFYAIHMHVCCGLLVSAFEIIFVALMVGDIVQHCHLNVR